MDTLQRPHDRIMPPACSEDGVTHRNCHCTRPMSTTEGSLRKGLSQRRRTPFKLRARTCTNSGLKLSPVIQKFRTFPSSLWSILLVLVLCILITNGQDFEREIHPSQGVLDFNKEEDNNNLDRTPLFDEPRDEDDFLPTDFRLFAVIGHFFNRSIVEALKDFDSELISDEDIVRVHFPSSQIPGTEWMIYHEDSGLLQGIPLSSHEGTDPLYVMITKVNKASRSTLTLPCIVEVLAEDAALELRQEYPNHPKLKIKTSTPCSHHEPTTVAIISVAAESDDLSYVERLNCVKNLRCFFGIPAEDVTFHSSPGSTKYDRPVMSGPGNVPKQTRGDGRDVSKTVVISWPLGCGSDTIGDLPILDKLESSAFDGSLARAIGYNVSEWRVVNRVRRYQQPRRMKRQVGNVPSSADIFYPRASKLRRRGNNNFRTMPAGETDEIVATLRHGRTRVDSNKVRATPVPNIPIMASKMVTVPLDRSAHIVPPSTPSIRPPINHAATESVKYNEPPMVLFGIENVQAILDTYMEFRIPNDVFFDNEDGMTRNLKLEVVDADTHQSVPDGQTWLMFDQEAQVLYGVPDETAVKEREYVIFGRDSGGKSTSITFHVYVEMKDKQKPLNHKFTFIFTEAPELKSANAVYHSFGKKLSVALAKSENMPGDITMVKTGVIKDGQRYVSWFDRSFNDEKTCRSADIKREANLMIGLRANEGRNRPAKEFAAKFRPQYKLKSIKIDLLGPCFRYTTTSPTSSTTTTTISPFTTIAFSESPAIQFPTTAYPTSVLVTTEQEKVAKTTTTEKIRSTTESTVRPIASPSSPRLGKPLPQLSGEVGRVVAFRIPSGTFVDPKYSESELRPRLRSDAPSWVFLNSGTRTLYLMPTREDFDDLESYNATHGVWKGSVIAKNPEGVESPPLALDALIHGGSEDAAAKANHRFIMKITNYNTMNFTAEDRLRLIYAIRDIFGDKDSNFVRFYAIEKGSVLFSWHNTSLAYTERCPYKKIAMIANTIFERHKLVPEVKSRFRENNFTVGYLNLTRLGVCKMAPNTPTPKSTTSPGIDVAVAGKQGKSTTIIIIALVVVCLVILIIILVVKCRMGQKSTSKKEKQEREDAAIAAGNPDMSDTPRIKKGVPIIFQDEIAMEPNGSTHALPTTPLMDRNNGDSRSPAVAEGDENIHEETPFTRANHPTTPPTPIMSDRPPPPYIKSR